MHKYFPLLVVLVFVTLLSVWHLTESPPTWMDEGIIVQVASSLAHHGEYGIQVAPGDFVSAGFVSTSYTVTFPVAVIFKAFGTSLVAARTVMLLYLLGFITAAYFLVRRVFGSSSAYAVLALLATFAPLYGHGLNVLGEVPGLFYLMLALISIDTFFASDRRAPQAAAAGIFTGLAFITKPIFILLLPALVAMMLVVKWKDTGGVQTSPNVFWLAALGFVAPLFVWLLVQFKGDGVGRMLEIYANPHSTAFFESIWSNLSRFVSEASPAYFAVIMVAWFAALVLRFVRGRGVGIRWVEYFAFFFAALVFTAYLRTTGYYRYFFLAEVLALLALPYSLNVISESLVPSISKRAAAGVLVLLVAFQAYQLSSNSWLVSNFGSKRSEALKELASEIPKGETPLLFQAPEAATFLESGRLYYQYMNVTETIEVGAYKDENGLLPYTFVLGERSTVEQIEEFRLCGQVATAERYVLLNDCL